MSVTSAETFASKARPLRPIPMLIFGSRWLQLPLYFGLIVAQGVYVVLFVKELWHLFAHSFDFSEQQIMLAVLGLIDVVMISNLLVMVIVGGSAGLLGFAMDSDATARVGPGGSTQAAGRSASSS